MERAGTRWVRRQFQLEEPPAVAAPEPAPTLPPTTFVDAGAELEGRLRLHADFRIDTEFRGEIASDATVVIGPAAGVVAHVRAREVILEGALVGNVSASRQLVIRAGGKLHGDVETPCLEIEKGAFFNGRTTMVRPEVAARARAESAESAGAESAGADTQDADTRVPAAR